MLTSQQILLLNKCRKLFFRNFTTTVTQLTTVSTTDPVV